MKAGKKVKKLKIGIIGCGGIANGKHMPALARLDNIEMTAFCDIVIDRAKKAAKAFGTTDACVYTDHMKLLEDKTIDVVHVCTPNKSHSQITVAALDAKKHVMCEKPMAKTAKEAQLMADAAKRNNKKLTIGYQNRHATGVQYLYKKCQRGDLGDIYFAKAHAIRRRAVPNWGVFLNEDEQGGGPLIDIGTHALDLTLWLMNKYEPKYVVGNAYHKLGKRKNEANAWGSWDPDKFTVEDSAFAFITMKDNSTIILESSWALNSLQTGEAMCTLCGTEAGADMQDGIRINGVEFSKMYTLKPALDAKGVDFYDGKKDAPEYTETREWINCIVNDTDPLVLPEQALVVTKILEAVYESSRTGMPVYFD